MKKAVSLLLIVCLAITLLAGCSGNASQPSSEPPAAQETATPQTDASQGESEPAAKKTMVIGDTTFNSENWEETVDPHRTYNGWASISICFVIISKSFCRPKRQKRSRNEPPFKRFSKYIPSERGSFGGKFSEGQGGLEGMVTDFARQNPSIAALSR